MNPLSSRKTIDAPRRRAFFYPLPIFSHPTADSFFVALNRPARWLLRAPAQIMQQSPDMVDVVSNLESLLDQFGHAWTGPQIGPKSCSQRPLEQQPLQLAFVFGQ